MRESKIWLEKKAAIEFLNSMSTATDTQVCNTSHTSSLASEKTTEKEIKHDLVKVASQPMRDLCALVSH